MDATGHNGALVPDDIADALRTSGTRDVDIAALIGSLIGLCSIPIVWNLSVALPWLVSRDDALPFAYLWCVVASLGAAWGFIVARTLARRAWSRLFQIAKYGLVGVLNAVLHAGIVNALVLISGRDRGIAVTVYFVIAFVLTITQSFLWHRYWTFVGQSHQTFMQEYRRFFMVTVSVLSLITVLFHVLVTLMGPHIAMPSRVWMNLVLVTLAFLSFVGNYLGYNVFVFREHNHANDAARIVRRTWCGARRPYLCATLISLLIGGATMVYKTTLPVWVEDDDIDLILAEQAKADPTFPDRTLVSAMGYDVYLYPKVIYALSKVYPIPPTQLMLIGLSTALTVFGAFVALDLLGFSWFVSLGVAIVGLLPRFAPADTFGGLLVSVTGRSFAIPITWVLVAWYVRRWSTGKSVWPVFFGIGLASYVHPVSLVTFVVVLQLIHTGLQVYDRVSLRTCVLDVVKHVAAFAVGAGALVFEIIDRAVAIATPTTGRYISPEEYLTALSARDHYEFIRNSLEWVRHEVIISVVFFACAFYVLRAMRTGVVQQRSLPYWTARVGVLMSLFAAIVHIAVPQFQILLVHVFNVPFILLNFCRTFKYFYLGLLLVFAVCVQLVLDRYGRRAAVALLVLGLASSSYSFEWAQFVLGYSNYQKEYIPMVLQPNVVFPNQYDEFAAWCAAFRDVGVREGDVVLAENYPLRYFCKVRPHITRDEGYAHIFMGRESLVDWYHEWVLQSGILTGSSTAAVLSYAQETGASAVVLPKDSVAAEALLRAHAPHRVVREWAIVNVAQGGYDI